MPNRLGSKKVAVIALIALGAIGGSAAYAYPSGTSMNLSVTANPIGSGGASVAVTVYNANPACTINIDVAGSTSGPVVIGPRAASDPHPTTVTGQVTTTASNGQRKVKVSATNCTAKEKVSTVFDIINARLETASTRYVRGERVKVNGFAFTPNSPIVFRLAPSDPNLGTALTATDITDNRGRASGSFIIPGDAPTGTWVIVGSTGSVTSEPAYINVTSS